ncbi:putative MFS family arabinose efflux permease [Serratia fonticola]|uniref:Putative MFS family arabinose efflux permease n=1 Tax=Serratia fonticola TaxID=47917 RepID=A0A559TBQ6_SERFO|nr:MFS transporter [Serratia fonticola]TQI80425.1 putative MFS family arabinose efflux permease [Serratia fonticola]TQI97549.1 putative MFS family arabinose efflux permease [Serratia fonticola]TVZ72047.1 putative MFS family arabinose efflux permease [Serratia fonticola]
MILIKTDKESLLSPSPPLYSPGLTFLLACACGLIVANIYYAQTLIGLISADLHLSKGAAGLIVTVTQIGYGIGLLLVVPLGDLFENRRLAISVMLIGAIGLFISAVVNSTTLFLMASLMVGLGSVTVQILVPYAAHLAPEAARGKVIGNIMSGLMLGIMLARPVASIITYFSMWRVVFMASCVIMLILAVVLRNALPIRVVTANISYRQMLLSMVRLVQTEPVLRRRAIYHTFMFAAFSLFWTTTPLLLSGPDFGISQKGIAIFALLGVAGAIAAPIASRIAKGWINWATAVAMLMGVTAFAITHIAKLGSNQSLALFVMAGVILDFAVSANLVLGQRLIFALAPEYRSRMNAIYMTTFFCGGAIGSGIGGWVFVNYGWNGASAVGIACGAVALLCLMTECLRAK